MSCRRVLVCAGLAASMAWAAPAAATLPDDGKLWRPPKDTLGVSPSSVAAGSARDGETRCSGIAGGRDLTGWIWATREQVITLMGSYAPELLTADPPSVSGPEYLVQALSFVEDVKPTFFFS